MKLEISDRIHRPYFWLLAFAVAGFVVVPLEGFTGLTGTHFQFGWPWPTLEGKIGYISSESPRGFHPYFDLFNLLNPVLWAAVFLGINRLAARMIVPGWLLYPGIVIFFSISLVMNLFGGFWFFAAMVGG